jgi:hypothetical protein
VSGVIVLCDLMFPMSVTAGGDGQALGAGGEQASWLPFSPRLLAVEIPYRALYF